MRIKLQQPFFVLIPPLETPSGFWIDPATHLMIEWCQVSFVRFHRRIHSNHRCAGKLTRSLTLVNWSWKHNTRFRSSYTLCLLLLIITCFVMLLRLVLSCRWQCFNSNMILIVLLYSELFDASSSSCIVDTYSMM